uniref:Uncharacterized protein n=1 Tax=Oryza sativa subsp. japonica TaxID=39947 RepID=Q6Z704_ORYSJ|nr:hypothetical protein [Oryza sativa Japonica Group]
MAFAVSAAATARLISEAESVEDVSVSWDGEKPEANAEAREVVGHGGACWLLCFPDDADDPILVQWHDARPSDLA